MEKWKKLLSKAINYKNKSESFLGEAVQELMRTKGFSEEQVALFDACFAGGIETVVTFNHDGEMNDLGLENYCSMTKEEIIYYLKKFLSDKNVELLTKG
jgi:hypothetical protein